MLRSSSRHRATPRLLAEACYSLSVATRPLSKGASAGSDPSVAAAVADDDDKRVVVAPGTGDVVTYERHGYRTIDHVKSRYLLARPGRVEVEEPVTSFGVKQVEEEWWQIMYIKRA